MGWETMRYLSCGRAWHPEWKLILKSWDAIISNVLQGHFQGPSAVILGTSSQLFSLN